MRSYIRTYSFVLAFFLLLSAGAGSYTTASHFQDKPAHEKWAADVDILVEKLPELHKNLFFKVSQEEFSAMAAQFKQRLPQLNEDEFQVGLSRLVAAVGDSHTSLRPRITHAFPLMLYWFKEGIYVINTLPEYKEILYGRIVKVHNQPIEEVIKAYKEMIPHENKAQLENIIPMIMASAQHLHGLNIIRDKNTMELTVENEQGKPVTVEMKAIPFVGAFKGVVDMSYSEDDPLYRKNRGQFYWFEVLEDEKTVYFKYNSCQNQPSEPFDEFSHKLLSAIQNNPVDTLVIDLRNNSGGDSGIMNPFIKELEKNQKINREGSLFVIIGRQTFSSAILNALDLKNKTKAILVGEPTGGKPNHFGEIKTLKLPNTHMVVTYSTKYFTHAQEDTPSLMPDIQVELSFRDYREKQDPFLEAVWSKNPLPTPK